MAGTFFGFNLLDGFPSNRFTSSDPFNDGRGRGVAESDSFGSFPNSPEDALTHPPAWIRVTAHEGGAEAAAATTGIPDGMDADLSNVMDHDHDAVSSFVSFSSTSIDDEDDLSASVSAEGVTILSSVPSSRASLPPPALTSSAQIVPFHVPNQFTVDIDSSMLSLATTESRYYERPLTMSSMHSSSLATSLGDLTLRSTVALDNFPLGSHDQAETDAASLVSIPLNPSSMDNSLSERGTMVVARQEPQTIQRSSCWFSRLSTEDDWDKFHQDVLEILCAVKGEYDVADNERLLARLIQQEEAAFWNDPNDNLDAVLRRRKVQKGLVLLGNAALLVAAPIIASSYWGALRLSRC